MEIGTLIATILWCATALLIMIEYAPYCKNLPVQDQIIVGMIFVFGGPIFVIANVLEAILDCILPEGWSDDGFKGN